eukprot:scaffold1527_cov143-Pinguiococcus_pyrenoidosus.AAC.1
MANGGDSNSQKRRRSRVLPSSPDMLQVKEAAKKRKRSEAAKKAARTRKKRQQQREQLQRQTTTATRRDLVGTTAATRRDLVGNFDEVAVDCQLPATAAIAGSPSSSKTAKLEEKVHQLETITYGRSCTKHREYGKLSVGRAELRGQTGSLPDSDFLCIVSGTSSCAVRDVSTCDSPSAVQLTFRLSQLSARWTHFSPAKRNRLVKCTCAWQTQLDDNTSNISDWTIVMT